MAVSGTGTRTPPARLAERGTSSVEVTRTEPPRTPKVDLLDRMPPQNLEAESSVLGAILLDNEAAWTVARFLKAEHFYKAANQTIYATILELVEARKPVDPVILKDELIRKGALEAIGGPAYIAELLEAVPSAANAEYYARVVRDKALLRSLISTATEIVRDAYRADAPADEIADQAEKRFFESIERRVESASFEIRDILLEEMSRIEAGTPMSGLMSRLTTLDELTNGFKPSELIILAARPSMGKTSLATTIIRNVAYHDRVPVAFFSLEMSKSQVAQNMLCQHARIDSFKMRQGRLDRNEQATLGRRAGELAEAPIFIDDTSGMSIMELRAKSRLLKARKGIGLIVIDYLQLMESSGGRRDENRQQEISQISRGLKQLARELDVPVIALSQLSRAVESREGNRPKLSDLRESGSIEQDADVVLMLYREAYYKPEKVEIQNKAEVIVAKNRNGPTGTAELYFQRTYTRFDNLASET
jgi:replicative DNA helicase